MALPNIVSNIFQTLELLSVFFMARLDDSTPRSWDDFLAEARMESVFNVAAFLVCSCRALEVGRSPVLKIKSELLGDSFTYKITQWACPGSLYFTQNSNEQDGVYHIYNFLRKPSVETLFSREAHFEGHAELNQDSETIWRTSYLNWCRLREPTSAVLEPNEESPLGKYHQQTVANCASIQVQFCLDPHQVALWTEMSAFWFLSTKKEHKTWTSRLKGPQEKRKC